MKKTPQKSNNCIFKATYAEDTPTPITNFLKVASPLSGRSLRQYFFKGLVRLNHRKAHSFAKVKSGDLIQVYGNEEGFQALIPESMLLDIIFENADLLVINKPAQLAVHPSGNIISGTLANGVAAYFEKNGLKIKVRPVNRLDYGTSGLIIFAKKPEIQTILSEATRDNRIHRIYYAVVRGVPDINTGIINLPIGEVKGKRIVSEKGQPAETHYQVIEEFGNTSLLELSLKSGRTHQIRVHLNHIGHQILGDHQYGLPNPFIKRPALHAGKLTFSSTQLAIPELIAPFPEDFNNLLNALRKNIGIR